jgi:hypothetical protein
MLAEPKVRFAVGICNKRCVLTQDTFSQGLLIDKLHHEHVSAFILNVYYADIFSCVCWLRFFFF